MPRSRNRSEWRYCKAIKEANKLGGHSGRMSWTGYKQLTLGFGAEDGDYITVCFRGAIGTKCQHIRLTEDEAEWLFDTGKLILDEEVKKEQERYEKEKEKKKGPTKEELFAQELEQRRQAMAKEKKLKAKQMAGKLWDEIIQPKPPQSTTPAPTVKQPIKSKRGRPRKNPRR